MTNLFKPKMPAMQAGPTIEMPEPSRTRIPRETDPDMMGAASLSRRKAMRRRGRLSTIMTDMTRETVGSSGQRLGS